MCDGTRFLDKCEHNITHSLVDAVAFGIHNGLNTRGEPVAKALNIAVATDVVEDGLKLLGTVSKGLEVKSKVLGSCPPVSVACPSHFWRLAWARWRRVRTAVGVSVAVSV